MATQPKPTFLFPLLFIISSSLQITHSLSSEHCNQNDKNTLLQIKNQMGPNSYFFSTWQPSTDCCKSWFNVACNTRSNRVNYLTIGQTTELSGPIPLIVAELSGLEVLFFNDIPGLTGPIPSAISNLTNLQDLEIYRNNLTGPIPDSLARLKKLTTLDLSKNYLSGPIPGSLSLLNNLSRLDLSQNRLTGSIPKSFANFKMLFFQAHQNRLSGPIPKSLNRAGFTWINFSGNRLTGDASFLFGGSQNLLEVINLKNNALSFNFSNVEFSSKIRTLDVSQNMIYGSLPNQLAELPLKTMFNVSYNKLCGPIPTGNWVDRFGVDAFSHNKCLCGTPLPPCKWTQVRKKKKMV